MRPLHEYPIRVYSADRAHLGLVGSLAKAKSELLGAREVIWRLFLRDFTAQFRQKLFGYVWAFIAPLVGTASFLFLHYSGVLNPGELSIPYPIYVFFGTNLWGFMMGAVGVVSGSLLAHGDLVLRTSIPKIALALAGIASLVYAQVVNLVILAVLLAAFGVAPSLGALAFPLLILPLVGLGVGIGLLVAVVGATARDIGGVVTTLLGLVMYVTPVIYAPRFDRPIAQAIVTYNPLSYLIDEPRNVFFTGSMQHPIAFLAAAILACIILMLATHGFYLIQDKVAERL